MVAANWCKPVRKTRALQFSILQIPLPAWFCSGFVHIRTRATVSVTQSSWRPSSVDRWFYFNQRENLHVVVGLVRSSDVHSACRLLFLDPPLTSVTKWEKLLALEIFLRYVCIWRKYFFFFFLLINAILAFFLYILRAFTNFVSCTIFHPSF